MLSKAYILLGLIAAFLTWKIAFGVSSAVLFLMSAMVMVFFTVFEKKGVVKYGQYQTKEKGIRNIKILFRHQIVKFSLVAILTGVVRTSVVFWLPTYISQHLDFFRLEERLQMQITKKL